MPWRVSAITAALLFFFFFTPARGAEGPPLLFAYNERPPYHASRVGDAIAHGLIADRVVKVVSAAGISATYQSIPTNRILADMEAGGNFCSFSWFQTKEREKFAKFSLPVWQDSPFVVVAKKENAPGIRRHNTLESVFLDAGESFGSVLGTAYNEYVAACRAKAKAKTVETANSQIGLIKMLAADRFTFIILVPEEIEVLFERAGVNFAGYAAVAFPEMPEGGKRRIMCGLGVDDAILTRIDDAIRKTL